MIFSWLSNMLSYFDDLYLYFLSQQPGKFLSMKLLSWKDVLCPHFMLMLYDIRSYWAWKSKSKTSESMSVWTPVICLIIAFFCNEFFRGCLAVAFFCLLFIFFLVALLNIQSKQSAYTVITEDNKVIAFFVTTRATPPPASGFSFSADAVSDAHERIIHDIGGRGQGRVMH